VGLGVLRALGIEKSGYALKEYIKLLEDAFSRSGDPGGWEHRFAKVRQIKTAYLFWIILILATFGIGVYFWNRWDAWPSN
jgi:hypothetical protein